MQSKAMKILIDINHPAHVHYFRNFARIMTAQGHSILFVSRNKEMEHRLLHLYGIKYVNRGKGRSGKLGKLLYLVYADVKLLRIAINYKPDLFLNFLHPYPSQVARLLQKPSLVFSDTEHAKLHHMLTVPFATKVLTPACYRTNLGQKHVRFRGFMELAYLHPRYFSPDPSVLQLLGLKESEPYVIVRFVSWQATHDFGHTGMSLLNKRKAVKEMSRLAKVLITSEGQLPPDLEQYRINIPVDKMHDALYYASLLFGESATMASEAAVLGTPSVFIDNDGRGYTDEQENRYGIVFNFSESEQDQNAAIGQALHILYDKGSRGKYKVIRNQIISENIDTTQFMIEQVMQYNTEGKRLHANPVHTTH